MTARKAIDLRKAGFWKRQATPRPERVDLVGERNLERTTSRLESGQINGVARIEVGSFVGWRKMNGLLVVWEEIVERPALVADLIRPLLLGVDSRPLVEVVVPGG